MSDIIKRLSPDEEWENLMRQLRNQPTAQPRPFFYTRVQARLTVKAPAASQLLPAWLRRPAYAALFGALVLVLSGDGAGLAPAAAYHPASPPPAPSPLPVR